MITEPDLAAVRAGGPAAALLAVSGRQLPAALPLCLSSLEVCFNPRLPDLSTHGWKMPFTCKPFGCASELSRQGVGMT